MTRTSDKRPHILGNIKGGGAYAYLGFTLAGSVLGLFFLGYWADGALGTRPWLAITGAFLGMAGGFINLVTTLNRNQKENERLEREKEPGDSGTNGGGTAGSGGGGISVDGSAGGQ